MMQVINAYHPSTGLTITNQLHGFSIRGRLAANGLIILFMLVDNFTRFSWSLNMLFKFVHFLIR